MDEILHQLHDWVEDFNSSGLALTFRDVWGSYLNLVDLWNNNHPADEDRIVPYSDSGFRKLLDKMGITRRRLNGEILDADHGAAQLFIQSFSPIVSEYDPDLVFNFDDTAFYWKQTINVTYCVKTIDPSGRYLYFALNRFANYMISMVYRGINSRRTACQLV